MPPAPALAPVQDMLVDEEEPRTVEPAIIVLVERWSKYCLTCEPPAVGFVPDCPWRRSMTRSSVVLATDSVSLDPLHSWVV